MADLGSDLTATARQHLRRNYILGVINGVAYRVAEAMIDSSLVLSWFVSQLTDSSLLVGLIGPIRNGGWFLPQLLVSGYVQRQERKLPLYRLCAVVRSVAIGLLALATWLLGPNRPGLLLACFFVLVTIFAFSEGFSGISFLDIIAKTIPPRRRGSFFAVRSFLGGVLALGSGLWVRYVLDERSGFTFAGSFGLLFSGAFAGVVIGVAAFSLVVEPLEPTDSKAIPFGRQLRRAWGCLRDRNFARLVLVRTLLILGSGLAAPFYIVYAKDTFGAPASSVGTFLLTFTLAMLASNVAWGRISDRWGNRAVILASSAFGMTAPLTALLAGHLGSLGLLYVPFALRGIYEGSIMVGHVSFVLDVAPATGRPMYIGLINTVLGVVSLTLMLGGLVVDLAGYRVLFGAATVFFVVGLVVARGLRDPRVAG